MTVTDNSPARLKQKRFCSTKCRQRADYLKNRDARKRPQKLGRDLDTAALDAYWAKVAIPEEEYLGLHVQYPNSLNGYMQIAGSERVYTGQNTGGR